MRVKKRVVTKTLTMQHIRIRYIEKDGNAVGTEEKFIPQGRIPVERIKREFDKTHSDKVSIDVIRVGECKWTYDMDLDFFLKNATLKEVHNDIDGIDFNQIALDAVIKENEEMAESEAEADTLEAEGRQIVDYSETEFNS